MVLVDDFSTNNAFIALEISLGKQPTVELACVTASMVHNAVSMIFSNKRCQIITKFSKQCFFFFIFVKINSLRK